MAYTVDDATIYYRRLTLLELQQIELRHTQEGVRDAEAIGREMLLTSVVGWANYYDPVTEEAIDFDGLSPAERERDILALPQLVQNAVVTLTYEMKAETERAKKNSTAGWSASTPSAISSQPLENGSP